MCLHCNGMGFLGIPPSTHMGSLYDWQKEFCVAPPSFVVRRLEDFFLPCAKYDDFFVLSFKFRVCKAYAALFG